MLEKLKSVRWGYILLGLLVAGVGILFLCFNNSLTVLSLIMGIIMTLYGIVYGVFTLAKRERSVSFALKIVISIISIACGVVTMVFHEGAAFVIANIFCLLLIVDGSFKLQTSILSKRHNVVFWWIMLILSLLIIVPAFLVTKFASATPESLAIWAGLIMIVDGLANILSTVFTAVNDKREEEYIAAQYEDEEDGTDLLAEVPIEEENQL